MRHNFDTDGSLARLPVYSLVGGTDYHLWCFEIIRELSRGRSLERRILLELACPTGEFTLEQVAPLQSAVAMHQIGENLLKRKASYLRLCIAADRVDECPTGNPEHSVLTDLANAAADRWEEAEVALADSLSTLPAATHVGALAERSLHIRLPSAARRRGHAPRRAHNAPRRGSCRTPTRGGSNARVRTRDPDDGGG